MTWQNISPQSSGMSCNSPASYNQLQSYHPPFWADKMSNRPSHYVQLSMRPTPIHPWDLHSLLPKHFQVAIKRDDMLGSTLSGNKVRKLEFLLAEALEQNCDSVVACGAAQSNCARACAIAARQLGLHPHLMLGMEGGTNSSALGHCGNVLLNKLVGSKFMLVNSFDEEGGSIAELEAQLQIYREHLVHLGLKPYVIPLGGFSCLGTWGYIEAFRELLQQGLCEYFDDIVLPIGSGGSAAGLAIGNYLTGSRLRIHGVCAYESASYFYNEIDCHLQEFGLAINNSSRDEKTPSSYPDLIDIIDGYVADYGQCTKRELDIFEEIVGTSGVCLDHFYNLKGVTAMLSELHCNPQRFQGHRILYLHTGGIFSLFDGTLHNLVRTCQRMNQVQSFSNLANSDIGQKKL